MSSVPYFTIEDMIALIDEPNRSACNKLLSENRTLFQTAYGSTHNHQAWPGGYFDHVQEIMNIAVLLYTCLNPKRQLPFSLSDALLITFLHDVEKPWKYEVNSEGTLQHKASFRGKESHQVFRMQKLHEYGIHLTKAQREALQYVEGELGDYTNQKRIMSALAAFCHLCDVTSARIWFDHPLVTDDPWLGAQRIRD